MKDALETTQEITKLIKYSPRREGIFRKMKESLSATSTPGIRVLCPTRWTVRADVLASIVVNYDILQSTFEESIAVARDTELKARIQGVSAQMNTFAYLYGNMLGEMILRHADNLSSTLQHKTMSAAEGQVVAQMTIDTIKAIRNDEMFDLFWDKVGQKAATINQ